MTEVSEYRTLRFECEIEGEGTKYTHVSKDYDGDLRIRVISRKRKVRDAHIMAEDVPDLIEFLKEEFDV